MGRNLDPKCKQCRRIGEKLFLKGEKCFSAKCPIMKRNYPPGVHGPKGYPRLSEYGQQLKEKQKAKISYRILEKQFHRYYEKSVKMKGDTGENLLRFLELRLDNIIFRLGLANSRDKARQLIKHGHITVNNRKVSIPSYQTKVNDIVEVKKLKLQKNYFKDITKEIKDKSLPAWLSFTNQKELEAKIIDQPDIEKLKKGIEVPLIVEYYSK